MAIVFVPTVANAENTKPISLSVQEKQEIKDSLVSLGSSEDVASKLVSKLESGQIWDSLLPDSKPIKTHIHSDNGTITTIETYTDGSIKQSQISDPNYSKDNNGERSVSGCKFTSGGGYAAYWNNCHAYVNLILVGMGFDFNYQNVKGKGTSITKYWNESHHYIGAYLSGFSFTKISPSKVRLSANLDVAAKGFPVGYKAWMQVNVSGTKAWTTNN